MRGSLGELDHEADLDGGVEGEGRGPERDAGVFAALAEDLEEEVGGAVDDLRVIVEVRGRVDESLERDDAGDAVEAAEFLRGRPRGG